MGKYVWWLGLGLWAAAPIWSQTPQVIHGADERFKADILVVVAHPDDEAGFTPYLARAIYDLRKRVVVVYGTRGGSGGNSYGREHGPALANIREIEARQACAKLGITEVWFLDGKDTASQNVLNSLANWGHGTNLEKLVGLIRLTRPEVVMTNLPGVFFGENHGDHQAAGVLTTEAFDLAGNPAIFPAQIAGDAKRNEQFLENLLPWQPKKLYYSSDMDDSKAATAYGPSYSIREISPSEKKSYWRLALDAATPHLTQFPQDIERVGKMSDEQLDKLMNDPNTAWWSEPFTLVFGKSLVGGNPTDDVFAHIAETPGKVVESKNVVCGNGSTAKSEVPKLPRIELGGPWEFYSAFYPAHGLCSLPIADSPEIGIKAGTTLVVPIAVRHDPSKTLEAVVKVKVSEGWKVKSGAGNVVLPAETSTSFRVEIETPTPSEAELKKEAVHEVVVTLEAAGQSVGEIRLRVKLVANALPE